MAPANVNRTSGWRSYEIYQRMRVEETTAKIRPRELTSDAYLADPYSLVGILRENYPCYRDWPGNAFWITRYDDVTSVFVDDANFGSRSRLEVYGRHGWGTDLGSEVAALTCCAEQFDRAVGPVVTMLIDEVRAAGCADVALDVAARLPLELLVRAVGIPDHDTATFVERYLRMQRGCGWEPIARADGLLAMDELAAYFDAQITGRRGVDDNQLVATIASCGGSGRDIAVTLLESDHQTLHGAVANLWFLLLTHPEQLDAVRAKTRLVRFAYLEALRHSPSVLSADRFARHEVERFGRLLPEGALVRCSAAAANRDPRVFATPDAFVVERRDLCQREPRGMYRADGLPSGISFGTGAPSRHPAVPVDRPRSRYAITRDLAVNVSLALLDAFPHIRLDATATRDRPPVLRSLRLGEMHTCWRLPVTW